MGEYLTTKQKYDLRQMLHRYEAGLTDIPGKTTLMKLSIELKDGKPIRSKPCPIIFAMQEELDKGIQHMIDLGVIEPSQSPYSTPLLIVKQKGMSNRYCLDFRQVNKHTIFDAEPVPDHEGIMAKIAKSRCFPKLAVSKGY